MRQRRIQRIVLADPRSDYRRCLAEFLVDGLRLHVVAEAEGGEEAVRQAAALRPDAVVVDVTSEGERGLDIVRQLAAGPESACVIALSLYGDRQFARAALDAGASAVVTKGDAVDQLPGVLNQLAARLRRRTRAVSVPHGTRSTRISTLLSSSRAPVP